jgi:hypothetical protein
MAHQWEQHDTNMRMQADAADLDMLSRAHSELARLPRWRQLIPLFGRAATHRLEISTADRRLRYRDEIYGQLDREI